MAASGEPSPLLLSGRAAQRLAAIYRQHNPKQPALAIPSRVTARTGSQALLHPLYTAVLDGSFHIPLQAPESLDEKWHNARDVHTEVCLTCATLRKLNLVHGSLAQVRPASLTPHACSINHRQHPRSV